MSKNIKPINNKGPRHGYWEVYWSNGKLMYRSFFHNGKEVGYEERYSCNRNKLTKKTYYI
jgi:antitoxin component YwqK of YwqJK toxin-antitoxin module